MPKIMYSEKWQQSVSNRTGQNIFLIKHSMQYFKYTIELERLMI